MARVMASPPPNTVTSLQMMLTASFARAAHTYDRLNKRASRRSTTLERSRDCNTGISTSNMGVLVFIGRRTPALLFLYFFEVADTSRKRLRRRSGEPLPPTTSGRILAHERRAPKHRDKWGIGVERMGGEGRKLGGGEGREPVICSPRQRIGLAIGCFPPVDDVVGVGCQSRRPPGMPPGRSAGLAEVL